MVILAIAYPNPNMVIPAISYPKPQHGYPSDFLTQTPTWQSQQSPTPNPIMAITAISCPKPRRGDPGILPPQTPTWRSQQSDCPNIPNSVVVPQKNCASDPRRKKIYSKRCRCLHLLLRWSSSAKSANHQYQISISKGSRAGANAPQ